MQVTRHDLTPNHFNTRDHAALEMGMNGCVCVHEIGVDKGACSNSLLNLCKDSLQERS